MAQSYKALLLDMHGTFMFGHDRFDDFERVARRAQSLGGTLPVGRAADILQQVFQRLESCYQDSSPMPALADVLAETLAPGEAHQAEALAASFAQFECGRVPEACALAIKKLAAHYPLALVSDIWSPKDLWLQELKRVGVDECFSACYFSSDNGVTKPAREPFMSALGTLGVEPSAALMVGDSPSRDLAGACAVGMDCLVIGNTEQTETQSGLDKSLPNLPALVEWLALGV
ncbi:MAG TPA: HAD family hydrolase [Cellvibrionaceae bacterium]